MGIYIDRANIPYGSKFMCHMMADTLTELHAFAKQLGIKRCWYHCNASYPHYDICTETRIIALAFGANLVDRHTIIKYGIQLRNEREKRSSKKNESKLFKESQIKLF